VWETWFITICTTPRGLNQLARNPVWEVILESLRHRQQHGIWFVDLLVLMPDHLHMLMRVSREGAGLKKVISEWKRWIARQCSIRWQRDFFDHRLRSDESRAEKAEYIVQNPVRAGLVAEAKEWRYVWRSENAYWTPAGDRARLESESGD
jgi:putative transposase